MILLIIAVSAGLIYGGKIIYDIWNEDLYINFKKDTVILEYGESFTPEDQICDHSQGRNIMIIYPSFTADQLGDFTVTYQLSNGLKSIHEDLKIKVVDTVPPVIILNKDEMTLTREVDDFIPEDYIKELSDNCDHDPNLTVGKLDWKLDEQDIRYVVSDASGNRTIAKLHVLIEDKPKPEPQASYSSQNSSSSSASQQHSEPQQSSGNGNNSSSSSGGNDTPPVHEAAAVYCHSVSVHLGTDPGTAAYSTYDGLSGNITVSIQYPELNTSVPGTYPVYYINQATGETIAIAYVTVTE